MEGIAEIAGLTASAASGGVVGIVGSALGRVFNIFERRMARKDRELEMIHERDRWLHEDKLIMRQMEARKQETELAIELAASEGSWKGLTASIEADAGTEPASPWVNDIRGVTRPTLTVFLWIIVATIVSFKLAGDDEIRAIIDAIIFSATTATVWWFGDRAPSRKQK